MNHHPKIKCPKCGYPARWNRKNLKLFNHEDVFSTLFNGNIKVKCGYGGKSIVHFYYELIDELKLYNGYVNSRNAVDESFMNYYTKRLEWLTTELRKFIENDDI